MSGVCGSAVLGNFWHGFFGFSKNSMRFFGFTEFFSWFFGSWIVYGSQFSPNFCVVFRFMAKKFAVFRYPSILFTVIVKFLLVLMSNSNQ